MIDGADSENVIMPWSIGPTNLQDFESTAVPGKNRADRYFRGFRPAMFTFVNIEIERCSALLTSLHREVDGLMVIP